MRLSWITPIIGVAVLVTLPLIVPTNQARADEVEDWGDLVSLVNTLVPAGAVQDDLRGAAEDIAYYEDFGTDEQLHNAENVFLQKMVDYYGSEDISESDLDQFVGIFDRIKRFFSRLFGWVVKHAGKTCDPVLVQCVYPGVICITKTLGNGWKTCWGIP